ncbi:MAG TPA: VWA domain-containing protein [Pyrinomonadaceae bacterium]
MSRCWFCLVLLAALCWPFSKAQTQQPPTQRPQTPPPADILPEDKDEVYRVETELVHVDATVTDATGRSVRGLQAQDFKLYEDGVERPLAFFNVERRGGVKRPVAVVFALDVSGSMTVEELTRLGEAMRAFTERLADRSSVFAVMTFGMRVRILQNFTNDPRKLAHTLDRLAREENGLSTHAYDAVDDAVRLLARDAPRTRDRQLLKRAVVLVTDGFPVGDTVAPRTVIERANAADVSVYTVTLPSFSRLLASNESAHAPLPTPLDVSGLVEKTGGTNVYATDRDFSPLFQALAEEVTSAYVLAFYPPEAERHDGRFHTIRIEAPAGLTVRQSRPGYQAK